MPFEEVCYSRALRSEVLHLLGPTLFTFMDEQEHITMMTLHRIMAEKAVNHATSRDFHGLQMLQMRCQSNNA